MVEDNDGDDDVMVDLKNTAFVQHAILFSDSNT